MWLLLWFSEQDRYRIRQEIHRQYKPRSCAARRYCGALSSSMRHKYLLGCMILSWTRSAPSQWNHIDDSSSSSSSHSPSAEMVVTHRWNAPESRPRHLLIRRAHHRSARDPTHRQQCLESRLRHGSFHADASCLRLGSVVVRLVGAGDNQLDCAILVSLTTVDDIQLVDQANVALAIVPTSSKYGDRFSLCCQTYMRERERERERASRVHTCVADERQTHSTLGKPDVHAHRTVLQFNNNSAANVTAEPQRFSCWYFKV